MYPVTVGLNSNFTHSVSVNENLLRANAHPQKYTMENTQRTLGQHCAFASWTHLPCSGEELTFRTQHSANPTPACAKCTCWTLSMFLLLSCSNCFVVFYYKSCNVLYSVKIKKSVLSIYSDELELTTTTKPAHECLF